MTTFACNGTFVAAGSVDLDDQITRAVLGADLHQQVTSRPPYAKTFRNADAQAPAPGRKYGLRPTIRPNETIIKGPALLSDEPIATEAMLAACKALEARYQGLVNVVEAVALERVGKDGLTAKAYAWADELAVRLLPLEWADDASFCAVVRALTIARLVPSPVGGVEAEWLWREANRAVNHLRNIWNVTSIERRYEAAGGVATIQSTDNKVTTTTRGVAPSLHEATLLAAHYFFSPKALLPAALRRDEEEHYRKHPPTWETR